MKKIGTIVVVAATLLMCSCGGTKIMVDGIEVYEERWIETKEDILRRVEFDFGCPAEQVSLTLFKRYNVYPTEVGIRGCDKQGVYVRAVGTGGIGPWVLNTGNQTADPNPTPQSAPPPPPPPPPPPAQ